MLVFDLEVQYRGEWSAGAEVKEGGKKARGQIGELENRWNCLMPV